MIADFYTKPCPYLEDYKDPAVPGELYRCKLSNKIMTYNELEACPFGDNPRAIHCLIYALDWVEKHKNEWPQEGTLIFH